MAEPVLICRDLRKRYGSRLAVDGVSFTVAAGECYGLLGPNGAGKTTTISMICGLLDRDGGEVHVAGRPLTTRSTKAKAHVGLVPQDIALYPDLSALENLKFFGRLYGLSRSRLHERVDFALEAVGLTDRARERVENYSGGMKRRANIAVGLLHDPRLLVLDEPTVGVDPQSRNAILATVAALSEQGRAVLYTTHYMEEAERLCDRVGIIDQGRIVAEGTRRELVSRMGQRDRIVVTATGDVHRFVVACKAIAGVDDAVATATGVELVVREARNRLAAVLEAAEAAEVAVGAVEVVEPDLEAVFLHLTGKALRD